MKNRLCKIKNRILGTSFINSVAIVATGSIISQIISLLVAPVLTRLYQPESFGIQSFYSSILMIIVVISCLRYELTIVLPEDDEDAANLLVISISICIFISILCVLLVSLFKNKIALALEAPELSSWLVLLPLSILFTGIFQAINYWCTRRKQFSRLSKRQVINSSTNSISQLVFGISSTTPTAGGLIGGSIIGQLIATIYISKQTLSEEGKFIKESISREKIKKMIVRYKDFPIYSSWSGLFTTMSNSIPILLLGVFYNPLIAGYFALGHRVLALPMSLIGSSIGQVFLPKAVEAKRKNELDIITLKLFEGLVRISFTPIILLVIVSPILFRFIFGSNWYTAGVYVQWMGLWMFINFVFAPLSVLYAVNEKQKQGMYISILKILIFTLSLIVGGLTGNDILTIKIFGVSAFIFYFINCTYILSITNIRFFTIIKSIFLEAFYSIKYIAIPIITQVLFTSPIITVSVTFVSGIVFLLHQIFATRRINL